MESLFEASQTYSSLFQVDFINRPFVQQSVPAPWFYVTVSTISIRDPQIIMYMMPNFDVLEDILRNQGETYTVRTIQYVTPGFMNETGEWKMEPLLEVCEVELKNCGNARIFTVEGGRVYLGLGIFEKINVKIKRIIFKQFKA